MALAILLFRMSFFLCRLKGVSGKAHGQGLKLEEPTDGMQQLRIQTSAMPPVPSITVSSEQEPGQRQTSGMHAGDMQMLDALLYSPNLNMGTLAQPPLSPQSPMNAFGMPSVDAVLNSPLVDGRSLLNHFGYALQGAGHNQLQSQLNGMHQNANFAAMNSFGGGVDVSSAANSPLIGLTQSMADLDFTQHFLSPMPSASHNNM
ncbi:hypothetical protein BC830DRAFT_86916, partial [Chytriomyces sp. MP71]